ncbi:MAG: hypothetical protein IKA17_00920 [Clostridia bacterium]|nr:hypothetical protein [Clostridia bacterium]
MNDLVLLLPHKEKGLFSSPVRYELCDDYIKLWIKDTPRALKKAVQIIGGNRAILSRDAMNMNVLKDCALKYSNISNEELFHLTEKCIQALIKKNNLRLPFYELFVCAIPDIAVQLIQRLRNYARIFTVIYNGEFDSGIFDGLYFKYGIITRHLYKMKNNEKENSLVITTDACDYIPQKTLCGVISLCDKSNTDNALMVKKVALRISGNSFVDNWGLLPSAYMCNLLNIEIDDRIEVDISRKADEIFMLDRTRF